MIDVSFGRCGAPGVKELPEDETMPNCGKMIKMCS